jgi:nucleoid-associated protein YgaU
VKLSVINRIMKHGFTGLSSVLILGCATAPPTQEMSDARQSVEAAQNIGAEQHAPAAMGSAQQLLDKAQTDIQAGEFEQAQKEAIAASEAARMALAISQARQVEQQTDMPATKPPVETVEKSAPPQKPEPSYYTVIHADNLWNIAAKNSIYGDPLLWPLILRANADRINHADLIYPGLTLTIEPAPSIADKEAAKQHALHRAPQAAESSDEAYLRQYGLR